MKGDGVRVGARRRSPAIFTLVLIAIVFPACRDDSNTVSVALQEWSVAPDENSTEAGEVTFEVTNEGTEEHELVIVRTDLSATELPTDNDGSFNEDGEGVEVIDEIEEFDPDSTKSITLDLEVGSYILLCNIVEETAGQEVGPQSDVIVFDPVFDTAHYAKGMRTSFTVQ